jgi:hypothetical protein
VSNKEGDDNEVTNINNLNIKIPQDRPGKSELN